MSPGCALAEPSPTSLAAIIDRLPSLVRRLDVAGVPARWAALEPPLTGLITADQLRAWTSAESDPDRADAVLGALVRLAAVDGGNDADAVVVLLHLLEPGVLALAEVIGDLSPDPVGLVVGELTIRIRTFPWRRRTRAYAANLLRDTRSALLREVLPHLRHRRLATPARREVLVDPVNRRVVEALLDDEVPGPEALGEPRLLDVMTWAAENGVTDLADLRVLLQLAGAGDGATMAGHAAQLRMSARTLRRRRAQAVAALCAARDEFLRAVA